MSIKTVSKQVINRDFFVRSGRSWWESLSPEEREKKRQLNIKASRKRWSKRRSRAKK